VRAFLSELWSQLKNALLAGLAVVLPLGITVWVVVSFAALVDSNLDLLPSTVNPETLLKTELPGLGILITVVLVTAVGAVSRYYIGQRIVDWIDGVLLRVPLLSGIYQGLKKLVDTLFSKEGMKFRQVVMVEYPRRGIWAVAFLTGEQADWLITTEFDGTSPVSLFLPTTPNPTSGFYLLAPAKDVRLLDVTVEEAFKLIMSAGIVFPEEGRALTELKPLSVKKEAS
jgi:uncharacterized membrane protein